LDICKELNITCPLKKGQALVAYITYPIPAVAPGGVTANVNVKVQDASKTQISCVDLDVKIVKGLFGHKFLFSKFVKEHGKKYEASELIYRMHVFGENFRKVFNHTLGGHSYTLALNEFADLTWEEFRSSRLGYKPLGRKGEPANIKATDANAVDWRAKGIVTDVKDQAQCGSCWAFSATGATESAYALTHPGSLFSFSEQQLVDCAGSSGNQGCNGGWMDYAFNWIIANGICLESDYPYRAADGTCKKDCKTFKPINRVVDVTPGSEDALMGAVGQQPVSVAIEADQSSFQFYRSGVMDGVCGKNLDHGVLAVGYGTDDNKDYWIVKNSWGRGWGEAGYIRLIRGRNQCGIAEAASFPIGQQ